MGSSCRSSCETGVSKTTHLAQSSTQSPTIKQLSRLSRFLAEGEKVYNSSGIEEKLEKFIPSQHSDGCKQAFFQTLIFLWLATIRPSGHRFSPPPLIDKVWHEFILFTQEYRQFCQKVAGGFIHHLPTTDKNRKEVEALPVWLPTTEDIRDFVGTNKFVEWCWKPQKPRVRLRITIRDKCGGSSSCECFACSAGCSS